MATIPTTKPGAAFDPDAFLAEPSTPAPAQPFDPDAFLADGAAPAREVTPQEITDVGTSRHSFAAGVVRESDALLAAKGQAQRQQFEQTWADTTGSAPTSPQVQPDDAPLIYPEDTRAVFARNAASQRQQKLDDEARLRKMFELAPNVDGANEVQVQQLARALGVSSDTVRENLPAWKSFGEVAGWNADEWMKRNPELTRVMLGDSRVGLSRVVWEERNPLEKLVAAIKRPFNGRFSDGSDEINPAWSPERQASELAGLRKQQEAQYQADIAPRAVEQTDNQQAKDIREGGSLAGAALTALTGGVLGDPRLAGIAAQRAIEAHHGMQSSRLWSKYALQRAAEQLATERSLAPGIAVSALTGGLLGEEAAQRLLQVRGDPADTLARAQEEAALAQPLYLGDNEGGVAGFAGDVGGGVVATAEQQAIRFGAAGAGGLVGAAAGAVGGAGLAFLGGQPELAGIAAEEGATAGFNVGARLGYQGGNVVSMADMAITEGGDLAKTLYEQKDETGATLDPLTILGASLAAGLINMQLEGLGSEASANKLTKDLFAGRIQRDPTLRAALKRLALERLKDTGTEMWTEPMQDAVREVFAFAGRGVQAGSFDDVKWQYSESDALEASWGAFAGSLPFGGGHTAVELATTRINNDAKKSANEAVPDILNMAGTQTAQVHPEAFAEVVADATSSGGHPPVSSMFLDADEGLRLMQQGGTEAQEVIERVLGAGAGARLAEAAATGGRLEIPMSQVPGFVNSELGKQLRDSLAADPTSLSPRQQKTQGAEVEKAAQALFDNAVKEMQAGSDLEASLKTAEDGAAAALEEKLGKRQARQVARNQTVITRAFMQSQAEKAGKTVTELFSAAPVTFREGDNRQATDQQVVDEFQAAVAADEATPAPVVDDTSFDVGALDEALAADELAAQQAATEQERAQVLADFGLNQPANIAAARQYLETFKPTTSAAERGARSEQARRAAQKASLTQQAARKQAMQSILDVAEGKAQTVTGNETALKEARALLRKRFGVVDNTGLDDILRRARGGIDDAADFRRKKRTGPVDETKRQEFLKNVLGRVSSTRVLRQADRTQEPASNAGGAVQAQRVVDAARKVFDDPVERAKYRFVDPATGMGNKRRFELELQTQPLAADEVVVALTSTDVKPVNDSKLKGLGHDTTDRLLRIIAKAVRGIDGKHAAKAGTVIYFRAKSIDDARAQLEQWRAGLPAELRGVNITLGAARDLKAAKAQLDDYTEIGRAKGRESARGQLDEKGKVIEPEWFDPILRQEYAEVWDSIPELPARRTHSQALDLAAVAKMEDGSWHQHGGDEFASGEVSAEEQRLASEAYRDLNHFIKEEYFDGQTGGQILSRAGLDAVGDVSPRHLFIDGSGLQALNKALAEHAYNSEGMPEYHDRRKAMEWGQKKGDVLLEAIAEAGHASGGSSLYFGRRSGDEYLAQGATDVELLKFAADVKDYLGSKPWVAAPGTDARRVVGVGINWGVGATVDEADGDLNDKKEKHGDEHSQRPDPNAAVARGDSIAGEGVGPDAGAVRSGDPQGEGAGVSPVDSGSGRPVVVHGRVGAWRLTDPYLEGAWAASPEERQQRSEARGIHSDEVLTGIVEQALGSGSRLKSTDKGYVEGTHPEMQAMDGVVTAFLNKNADASTVIHEGAHGFMGWLQHLAAQPDATEATKKQWADATKALTGRTLTSEEFNALPEAERVAAHEKFARSFEQYVKEGKAPSAGLKRAFAAFSRWLLRIYAAVKTVPESQLNDDMRDVFDAMLTTQAEVKRARQQQGPRVAATQQQREEEDDDYTEGSYAQQLRVVKVALRRNEAWWKAEVKARAVEFGDAWEKLPAVQARKHAEAAGVVFDRAAVDAVLKGRKLAGIRTVKEGGLKPDVLASLFNFATGEEMLKAIAALPAQKETWVQAQVDQHMREKFPGVLDNIEEFRRQLAGDLHAATVKRVMSETKVTPAQRAAAQKAAELLVQRRTVRELRPAQALRAQRMAAEKKAAAMAKGDARTAALAAQQELLNLFMHQQLLEAEQGVAKFEQLASEMKTPAAVARLGKASPSYRDAAAFLLGELGLGAETEFNEASLTQAVAQANGDAVLIGDPEWLEPVKQALKSGALVTRNRRGEEVRDFRGLNVAELAAVHDALLTLRAAARQRTTALVKGKRVEISDFREQLKREARENKEAVRPVGEKSLVAIAQRAAHRITGPLLKIETIVDWLGGSLVQPGKELDSAWHSLFVMLESARQHEADLQRRYAEPVMKAFRDMPAEVLNSFGQRIDGKALFPTHRLVLGLNADGSQKLTDEELTAPSTVGELFMMLLNAGNEENLQRLVDGRNITREQVFNAFNRYMTPAHIEAANAIGEAFETMWPEIQAMEERIAGVKPTGVEKRPLQLKAGLLRGHYFPAIYDPRVSGPGINQSEQAQADAVASLFSPTIGRPQTTHGHRKARAELVYGAINLDAGSIGSHLAQHAHDLAFYERVGDVWRILDDRELRGVMNARLGYRRTEQVYQWVKDAARVADLSGSVAGGGFWSFLRKMQANQTIALLGYSVPNVVEDAMAPLAVAFDRDLQPSYYAKGLLDFFTPGSGGWDALAAKSKGLATAEASVQAELARELKRIDQSSNGLVRAASRARDVLQAHAFAMNEVVFRYTAGPAWLGRYQQALAEGADEAQAQEAANALVRRNWPSFHAVNASGVSRDVRLKPFVPFYGYFSTVVNKRLDEVQRVLEAPDAKDKARAAGRLLGFSLVASLLAPAVKEMVRTRGAGPDEPPEEWALWTLLQSEFGMLPLAGDFANVVHQVFGKGMRPSPRASAVSQSLIQPVVALKALTGDSPGEWKAMKAYLDAFGLWFGLPTSTVKFGVETGAEAVGAPGR